MIGTDIQRAIQHLSNGEVVAIPTETVYGLAANALNPEAVAKIYEVKQRPKFNPLILHFSSLEKALPYIKHIPESLSLLAKEFWPGPISLLLEKSDLVPDLITAGSSKVVIRVPAHPLTLELLEQIEYPIAAPSANISNTVSPTTAQHVNDSLGTKVPYILDGGRCNVGLESTIVGIKSDKTIILRAGGVSKEDIEQVIGKPAFLSENKTIQSPGQLSKHYSTSKPLYILDNIESYIKENDLQKASVLMYEDNNDPTSNNFHYLSKEYNLAEIAANLFSMMREADQSNSEYILIEKVKEIGIGKAIADRLQRASSPLPMP